MELLPGGDAAVHFAALSNYLNTPTIVWARRTPVDSGERILPLALVIQTSATFWGPTSIETVLRCFLPAIGR